MEIPETDFAWFTILLDLEKKRKELFLVVDWVPGFEKALSRDLEPVVFFEFLENGGIPCRFRSRVSSYEGHTIRVKVPETIQRVQRRECFRMRALSGSEVILHENPDREQRATIRDYSLGGVAVFLDRPFAKALGERVKDLLLRIRGDEGSLEVLVPLAIVRRISTDTSGKLVCALEFIEMEDAARESLWHHLLEEQRSSIRRFRRI